MVSSVSTGGFHYLENPKTSLALPPTQSVLTCLGLCSQLYFSCKLKWYCLYINFLWNELAWFKTSKSNHFFDTKKTPNNNKKTLSLEVYNTQTLTYSNRMREKYYLIRSLDSHPTGLLVIPLHYNMLENVFPFSDFENRQVSVPLNETS